MTKSQALHKLMIVIGLLFILLVTMQTHASPLHHQLDVELQPGLKMIKAQDTVTFPQGSARKISFLLHKDLHISVTSPDDTIVLLHAATQGEIFSEYGLELGTQDNKVSFQYFGVIYDPVVNDSSEGLISPEGATLFGSTHWYPDFLGEQKSFQISIQTPSDWRALSQGQMISTGVEKSVRNTRFAEIYPQEEIYLIAGPFTAYEIDTKSGKKISVLLRKADPALAQNFLSLIPDYIDHYSTEIAPYPYSSFTVVENLWETGYGMPSFTLLGPTVIRLPFILKSSLPHEVLHNWWGNSVYVDYDKGNWSEGLTTYMADHWQQQLAGTDRAYRLTALMNYSDFVSSSGKDFPLRQFKGRHNSSSQAVGYGKSMMLFHMLEFKFGPEIFKKALQDFYSTNLFQRVSFTEIQKSFEKITNQDLEPFFSQWLDRMGAPRLELTDVKVMHWLDGSYSTTYLLTQKQDTAYDLSVPVIWTLESGEEVRQLAKLNEKALVFSLVSKSRPTKVSVDPDFHVFRDLYLEERPATLSSVLGNPKVNFYYGSQSSDGESFAKSWAKVIEGKSTFNKVDGDFAPTPEGSIVLIGDNEQFVRFMKTHLQDQKFDITATTVSIEGQVFDLEGVSTLIVARNKNNPQQTIVWVRWSQDNNPTEWAQRLTHYGTFGILVFKGRPAVLKSTWPVLKSPLQRPL